MRSLILLLLLGFASAQISTPEVQIPNVQPFTTEAMGIPVDYVFLTDAEWNQYFPDLPTMAGMASYDGKTIFVRYGNEYIIPHEFSHIWQMHWELEDEGLEPECVAHPELFTGYLLNQKVDYICQKTEIWARYHAEVIWFQNCAIGSYFAPAWSLAPFGFPQEVCPNKLDYADYGYDKAVNWFLNHSY